MFYESLPADYKDNYAHLTESKCFKPAVNYELYYKEFYSQALRCSENPSLFLWHLQKLLHTMEPDLTDDAFSAFLQCQFMRGLPWHLRLKLLESNPTPNLANMVQFAQQLRALDALPQCKATCSTTAAQPLHQPIPVELQHLDCLEKLVYEMAANRPPIVAALGHNSPVAQSTSRLCCCFCGEIGHVVCSCALHRREK